MADDQIRVGYFASARKPIRVMIVDDHPIFREGLRMMVDAEADMSVIALASTVAETLNTYRQQPSAVILIDKDLQDGGMRALISIRSEFHQARTIMLARSCSDVPIRTALEAGAAAYVLKSTPPKELLRILRTVAAGRKFLPSNVAQCVMEHFGMSDLTPRELAVLALIPEGKKNKQIAERLSISEATVNFHIRNILLKLQANDRTHAVAIAWRRGMLEI